MRRVTGVGSNVCFSFNLNGPCAECKAELEREKMDANTICVGSCPLCGSLAQIIQGDRPIYKAIKTRITPEEFWREYYHADPDFPPSEAACQFAKAYAHRLAGEISADQRT